MKEHKDNIVMEFYSHLDKNLLNLSRRFFENKYSKTDNLNLKIQNYFYDLINKQESSTFDKFNLYNHLYPNQAYNDSKLTSTLNRHLSDLKEFALISELNTGNNYVEIIWTNFLINHNMKRNLTYNMNRKEKLGLDENHLEPIEKYFNSREKYYYNLKFNELIKSFKSKENLEIYLTDFESYAVYTRMMLYIGLIVQYLHLKEKNNIDKLKMELGDSLRGYLVHKNFHISSISQILHLYLSFNEDLFNQLYNNVLENLLKLSSEKKIFYLNNLINFIIIQFNNGLEDMKTREYELYMILDELKLLDIQNSMTYRKLSNIIYASIHAQQIDKAEYFLNKYITQIPLENKTSCYAFNKARLLFVQKDYTNVLVELNKVNFSISILYTLISKRLELLSLVSLGQFDVATIKLNTFAKFVKENKKITNHESLNSFIKLCRILILPLSASSIKRIQTELENKNSLDTIEKKWVFDLLKK